MVSCQIHCLSEIFVGTVFFAGEDFVDGCGVGDVQRVVDLVGVLGCAAAALEGEVAEQGVDAGGHLARDFIADALADDEGLPEDDGEHGAVEGIGVDERGVVDGPEEFVDAGDVVFVVGEVEQVDDLQAEAFRDAPHLLGHGPEEVGEQVGLAVVPGRLAADLPPLVCREEQGRVDVHLGLAARQALDEFGTGVLAQGQRLHALEALLVEVEFLVRDLRRGDARRVGDALFRRGEAQEELPVFTEIRVPYLIASDDEEIVLVVELLEVVSLIVVVDIAVDEVAHARLAGHLEAGLSRTELRAESVPVQQVFDGHLPVPVPPCPGKELIRLRPDAVDHIRVAAQDLLERIALQDIAVVEIAVE